MDVHPPHQPVHTWREALTHIGLMTVGLLIALSLEASIEYLHHKHLVREARETIRQEIEQNQKNLQKDISSAATQSDRMKAALATMQRLRAHPQEHGSIEFNWNNIDLNDAAWRSARDTGALGYTPYAEVRDDASLYALQTSIPEQMAQLTSREFEVIAPSHSRPKVISAKFPKPNSTTCSSTQPACNWTSTC